MYRLHHIGFAAICLFATADADQSRSPMAEFGHVEKRFAAFVPQAANDACVVIDVNADETPVGRLIFGEAAKVNALTVADCVFTPGVPLSRIVEIAGVIPFAFLSPNCL